MSFACSGVEELRAFLAGHAEEKFRLFNEGLIPGGRKSFGVRAPVLKELARDIARGDWQLFIAQCPTEYHEERMLLGIVIATAKMPLEKRMEYIRSYVPLIDNWAICDCFCASLKEARKRQKEYFELISGYLDIGEEYQLRFAAVMLLDHFINEGYIDRVLEIYQSIKHEGYYVKMAVAWGLSVCFVKFPDPTATVFRVGTLDDFTHNKAIQKCRESFRVSDEDKEMLWLLKR